MKPDLDRYMSEDDDGDMEFDKDKIIQDMRTSYSFLYFMNYVLLRLGPGEDDDFEDDEDEEEFELDPDVDYGASLPMYFTLAELTEVEEMYVEERYRNMIRKSFGYDPDTEG